MKSQEEGINCSSRRAKTKTIQAKATKSKRYDKRIEQYRIKRLFHQDQKTVYQELNGKAESSRKPDTEESNIWGTEKSHNKDAEWLKELR